MSYSFLKRTIDLVVSFFTLIFLLPFFLFIGLLVVLTSKGPIFVPVSDGGIRVGKVGKPFRFYKFRSMQANMHHLRYTALAEKDIRKGTPMVKIKDDPRITKIGKVIRKWGIDELPQLINVLLGDMSLVGPRPHLPEEVKKYTFDQKKVLQAKPGITGLAQVHGASRLDFNDEIAYDLYYIEKRSFLLDLKVLFLTPWFVIRNRGVE